MDEKRHTKLFAEVMVWSGLAALLVLAFLGGYALADLVL